MNKAELIEAIAVKTGLTKSDAGKSVEALVETVTAALAAGDEVKLPGFGSFVVSDRAERIGRNPRTGESTTIAASKAVKFKVAKGLKDAMAG